MDACKYKKWAFTGAQYIILRMATRINSGKGCIYSHYGYLAPWNGNGLVQDKQKARYGTERTAAKVGCNIVLSKASFRQQIFWVGGNQEHGRIQYHHHRHYNILQKRMWWGPRACNGKDIVLARSSVAYSHSLFYYTPDQAFISTHDMIKFRFQIVLYVVL